MQSRGGWIGKSILALLLLNAIPCNAQQQQEQQEYADVNRLRWVGPGQPGTYEEYLSTHPVLPLVIERQAAPEPAEPTPPGAPRIFVIVNSTLQPLIQDNVNQYITDVQISGYDVVLYSSTWGNAAEIRSFLQSNSTDLVGCVLIGDIPSAWYEVVNDYEEYGYAEFPCDLFLMDLDGVWYDEQSTAPMQAGVYDGHADDSGDVAPEIFIGRIDASLMTGAPEADQVNAYLNKLHNWYSGAMTVPDLALTYTEDDWAPYTYFTTNIASAYQNNEAILAPDTNRDDYRDNRLTSLLYQFIQLSCHSSSTRHAFTRGGSLYSADIKVVPPQALFYNLFCCSALRYTDSDYTGGAYIFNPSTTALSTIGSTKTGSMLAFYAFYGPLGEHKSMGQAMKEWFETIAPYSVTEIYWHYGMTIIGDPLVAPLREDVDPIIVLDSIADEVSGDVVISYSIIDTRQDTLRIVPEYSVDSWSNWIRATTSSDTVGITPVDYSGSLIWYSAADLDGKDVQDLSFRITPCGRGYREGEPDEIFLHVDNNEIPTAAITDVEYVSAETFCTINYELSDAEGDTLCLQIEYSIDGGSVWSAATTSSTITNIETSSYINSVLWAFESDLLVTHTEALFRITPCDNDTGLSDQTTIQVVVLGLPEVMINCLYNSEQRGDIEIPFTITDDESDGVGLFVEYLDAEDLWQPATVTGDTSSLNSQEYSGTLVWNSAADLPGIDLPNTGLRLTPSDANAGFAAEMCFHVDNNAVPSVQVTAPDGGQYRDVNLTYILSDAEGDTLSILAQYSSDGGSNWYEMSLSVDSDTSEITPDEYEGQLTWNSSKDLGCGEWTDAKVKLLPYDLDHGVEDTTGTISIQNWIADFSGDGFIRTGDFNRLLIAYLESDATCDIGPAAGTPPHLVQNLDGVIDFEDLAVFIVMWNWSLEANGGQAVLSRDSESSVKSTAVQSQQSHLIELVDKDSNDPWSDEQGILDLDLRANQVSHLMVAGVELRYDPDQMRFIDLEPGTFLGEINGEFPSQIHLKHVDEAKGILSLMFGRLDAEDPTISGSGLLATLHFTTFSNEKSEITVAYELWNDAAQLLKIEQYSTDVHTQRIPGEFALLQNYPNPFNGETVIRYQLPAETRVQIHVYNIRGQQVATLVDEMVPAGYHKVSWSGNNDAGRQVASGVYIYLIQAGRQRQSLKMTIVREEFQ